jgi:hypothetical protein
MKSAFQIFTSFAAHLVLAAVLLNYLSGEAYLPFISS